MKSHPSHRGVALIIVLGFLVILSGLAIAFFSSVTTELTASRTYSNGVTTRQLSESAVNVVMGQIREATARENGAWASQPGMIRVYRDGSSASPKADAFFKLYSARNMVVTKGDIPAFDPSAEPYNFTSDRDGNKGDVPSDWNQYPALFADLNSPVLVSDPAKTNSQPEPVFPIVDPRAMEKVNGEPLVEGFEFSADVNGAVASGDSEKWRLPMPVRWIYVLQDGTLTVPDQEFTPSGGGSGAEWKSSSNAFLVPSKDNPIVGRVAFWADDDSSKININTAGGRGMQSKSGYSDGYTPNSYAGSFWDTPRFYTNFDIGQTNANDGTLIPNVGAGGLASTQPFQKEYQRYPGHPATTSLGAVFSRLLTSEQIYKLTPRLNGGGSVGGTVRTERAAAEELQLKSERLYASLDELLYSAQPVKGGKRETNDRYIEGNGAVSPDKLERMKFFLTAHSRSPDLNLFGRPRVAIWPVNQSQDEALGRNGFDRAIAFCSTIGGQKFIFTRSASSSGALSTTVDITSATYSRNVELLKYLRELTDRAIPGFGGNFKTKYGEANRDAILGQIFDYIRIANLRDTTTGMTTYQYAARGVVAPSRADVFGTGKKIGGFGRWSTISEATIVFYCSGVSTTGEAGPWKQAELPEPDKSGISHRQVRAFVVFSTFDPMQGYAPKLSPSKATERQVIEVTGLDEFKINGIPLGFPSKAVNNLLYASGDTWGGRNFGGYEGFFHTLKGHSSNNAEAYSLQSGPGVPLAIDKTTFSFSGGDLEVKIKFGTTLLQTIKLKFPAASWPVPERWYRLSAGGFIKGDQGTFNVAGANIVNAQSLAGRIAWSDLHSSNPNSAGEYAGDRFRQILQPGDVVRSLVYGSYENPAAATNVGDFRILALTEDVPNTEFRPHPDYFESTRCRFADGLRAADGSLYMQGSNLACWKLDAKQGQQKGSLTEPATAYGKHVPSGVSVNTGKCMILPQSKLSNPSNGGIVGVVRADGRAGDFDTGMGTFADGPYAGKQDEGNVIFKYFDNNLQKWIYPIPYANTFSYEPPGDIFFSPNRQMPSPGLFGSLLSRPKDTNPRRQWETLAFCPNTVGERHPGNIISPKDHLLLDFFTMPFVEPYLISEPLSTAGRVNLNYQIAPFGYITRSTGLRAALHPLRVTAVSTALMNTYKSGTNGKPLAQPSQNPRFEINRDETIKAINGFFKLYKSDTSKGFFKSASEICERFLYPEGSGVAPTFTGTIYDPVTATSGEANIINFWRNRTLTGDNVREKPYTDLYPRITTKSNTYTVHLRVQTVRQLGVAGDFKKWQEGRDVVVGEYRGSTTIERFIDPSDPRLPQKVLETNQSKQSLEDIYRFRVVDTKKFAP